MYLCKPHHQSEYNTFKDFFLTILFQLIFLNYLIFIVVDYKISTGLFTSPGITMTRTFLPKCLESVTLIGKGSHHIRQFIF